MCCCYSITPMEAMYPGIKHPTISFTFNYLVYCLGRKVQLDRENKLAEVSGMAAIGKMMG